MLVFKDCDHKDKNVGVFRSPSDATSSESLLARNGVVEYAWIVWSDPVVLASFRIWPYMVL